jgi:hypothetical protein
MDQGRAPEERVGQPKHRRGPMKHSVRCAISVLGPLLVALVFGVGFASAMSPGETTGTAESVVTRVTETSRSALPDPMPPATPEAPAAPRLPVKAPRAGAPTSSSSSDAAATLHSVTDVPSPGGRLPSVDGAAGDTTGVADRATSTEAVQQVSASANNGFGGDSNLRGAARGSGPTTPGENRPSIDSAEVAPLRWFLTHVWPAIALGRASLTTPLEQLEGTTSLLPTDAAQSLTEFSGAGRPGGDRTPPAAHPAQPNGLYAVTSAIATAAENYLILIVLSLVVLMGSFVIRAEYRSLSRPH